MKRERKAQDKVAEGRGVTTKSSIPPIESRSALRSTGRSVLAELGAQGRTDSGSVRRAARDAGPRRQQRRDGRTRGAWAMQRRGGRRPHPEAPAGDELTRGGIAERLGCSVATIRRMEGKELRPRVGPDGVHYFRKSEVDNAARHYVSGRDRKRVERDRHEEWEGKLAARVFELFDNGCTAAEVVKRLEIVPARVIELVGQWNEMRLPPTVQVGFKPNPDSARRGDERRSDHRGARRP